MFKQSTKSTNQTEEANSIIEKLGAITTEQQSEFAKITGRFDSNFKIGKVSDVIIGKAAYSL